MKSVSAYQAYDAPKPQRKWPLVVMILLCVALLAGCCVAFWQLNAIKYEETVQLAQAGEFDEAEKLSKILMPMYDDLPQLKQFIQAGWLMGEDGRFRYEESRQILLELGDYLNAPLLYKENRLRYAQQLFGLERYEEALDILQELGDYGEAEEWADECEYRIGLGYYTQLSDETDREKILEAAQEAIRLFSSVGKDHKYAGDMLERVSSYMYALGTEAFTMASAKYNVTQQPGDEEATPAEGGETAQDADAQTESGDGQEEILAEFQNAAQYFNLIPDYEDSGKYLEILDIMNLPEEEAALKLREEYWDFAPARKFVLGKYIPYFFYGKWMINEHYYLEYTDAYRFYMLRQDDGTDGEYGSGGISLNTRTGWKSAYQFKVLGKDSLEVQSDRVYTLTRLTEDAQQDGTQEPLEQLEQAGEAEQSST